MSDKRINEKEARSGRKAGGAFSSLGLPADADGKLPLVTITGDRFVKVEHHRGILLFTECCVRLFSASGVVRISGKCIAASKMDGDEILLEGKIGSVSFE